MSRGNELFQQAVEAAPDDVPVRHAAVAFYLQTGSILQATEQLREVVRIALVADDRDEAVAALHPGAWVIGSDQVAELDGCALGKPHRRDAAIARLQALSGREARFHTALCVARVTHEGLRNSLHSVDLTVVRFRPLTGAEIERYVDAEQPLDCAGSFKCEGLGIALFDAIETADPTALVGLPLIATARLLRDAGFTVP